MIILIHWTGRTDEMDIVTMTFNSKLKLTEYLNRRALGRDDYMLIEGNIIKSFGSLYDLNKLKLRKP